VADTFTLRLKPDERAILQAEADSAGVSLGEHIRSLLLQHEHDLPARVSELERRLASLERLAEGAS
jgi:hypothetical protein